jgi:DNA polymerase
VSELFLDFETRSCLDLKKVGAYRYAEDPSTEALMATFALDRNPLLFWARDAVNARDWWTPAENMLRDPHGPLVVAHNAGFERLILKEKFGIDLPASRFRCTAAQAARMSLPRSLEAAGVALELEFKKDAAAGHRLITKLSKPRTRGAAKGEFYEREDAPDDFDAMEDYNGGDVETMRELHYLLPQLTDREQALWELTERMNDRGMLVDLEAARRMEKLASAETAKLAARWVELVGLPPGSPKAAKALGLTSLAKVAVRHALKRTDLSPKLREALLLRQRIAKTSVKKLAAFFARTNLDSRVRGTLVYAGAERTARWSARGVQPHNFPRGLGPLTEDAFDALLAEEGLGGLGLAFDDVLRALSDMLKGLLVGPFLVGDFGQIEARTLAVLAGQWDLVDAFEQGTDVYCAMASDIYGEPVTKSDYDEKLHIAKRQLGKVAVLGFGYGLGAMKFIEQMDKDFDVQLPAGVAFDAVEAYRSRYAEVPRFWNLIERLWRESVRRGSVRLGTANFPVFAGTQSFSGRPFAWLEMPNGERMWYYRPEADRRRMVKGYDDELYEKVEAAYFGRDLYTHKWQLTGTYGGKLTENYVQKTAREVLADAMLALDRAGFPLVLQVHDECVAEAPAAELEAFTRIMSARPAWLPRLPVVVESFAAGRYHK